MTDALTLITARRQQIVAERAQHQDAIKVLDAEDAELTFAEQVVRRLSGLALRTRIAESVGIADGAAQVSGTGALGKPADTPTMPEMIVVALNEARFAGLPGLTPKELASAIANRWWPGVTSTEVGPIAWRIAKRGQIEKVGKLYRAPEPDANGIVKVSPPEGDEPPIDDAE